MDKEAIKKAVVQLLTAIGEDPTREGVRSTPERYADACAKLFEGYTQKPEDVATVFDGENYDEMVVVKDIEFYSNCEHHILPFYGKAHIGYIPADKIIGLSKLPRLVEMYARRLQNQERLTSQIAGAVNHLIAPKGVGVVIEAHHFCMMARGVEKQNSVVTTSAQFGLFKNNDKTRAEFLRLIGR